MEEKNRITYRIINHNDEKGRMNKLPTYVISKKPGQITSDGYSYLYARETLQRGNKIIGLGKLIK